jgi:hypothetical protein
MPHSNSPLHYQVSIIGPAAGRMPKKIATQLVERRLEGENTGPYQVRIKIWRGGQEIDFLDNDDSRAEILKATVRRYLREGKIHLTTMGEDQGTQQ